MTRKIIHVDMDCFYAAVEIRDNPALSSKPVAIGGTANKRGVLCTCNYVARKFGVHSAMATAHAQRLCPELVLLPVDMSKYHTVSKQVREIFYEYTNLVEPLSLDEAYLDVSTCQQYGGSATMIAKAIRRQITERTQLTASAGVAPNKFLAKIASDWNKPDGLFVVTPHEVADFVKQLPIEKIFGVGKVTAQKMHGLGIKTCSDLQQKDLTFLQGMFGKWGQRLYGYSRGIDNRDVQPSRVRKSLSAEITFAKDLKTLVECLEILPSLYDRLEQRLLSCSEFSISKQFVKVKFNDFTQTTVEHVIDEPRFEFFKQLLVEGYQRHQKPVRLLGVGVRFTEASDGAKQLILL